MDNLNTHKYASLYKVFSPEEARRIIRLEGWKSTIRRSMEAGLI